MGYSVTAPAVVIRPILLPRDSVNHRAPSAGPDGALWFTESLGNKIGRITTAGAVTEYPIPTSNSGPYGIVAGPDGALWFTEQLGGKIGRITTTGGSFSEYQTPTS